MEKIAEKAEKMPVKLQKKPKKPPLRMKKSGITAKQLRFAQEYVVDRNITQAAIRAGYTKRSAYSTGHELLQKPEVQAEVERLTAEIAEKAKIKAEDIVRDLIEVKDRCMQKAPVMTFTAAGPMQLIDEEGRNVWKFDANGANKSLELLGKHIGMFVDRKELTGRGGGPLQVNAAGVLLVPAEVALKDWQLSAQEIADKLEADMIKALAVEKKKGSK